jgi:putative transcriptional regulator
MYGVKEAAIEAANSGLQPLVVCVEDESASLMERLEAENISYELIDISKD